MNVLIYINGEEATEECRLQDTRISYDTSRRISTASINVMGRRVGDAAVYDEANFDVHYYGIGVEEMYRVTIYDGRDGFTKLFEGQIYNINLEQTDAAPLEVFYHCDLNDYGAWLDRAVAWGGITIAMPTTDQVLIQTIVRTFCPQINADDVAQLIPAVVDYDWRTKTARQVLDDMATLSLGEWWVDYDAKLHYGAAHPTVPAPFRLSTTPDFITSFPVRVSGFKRDFSNPVNSAHVRGANDALAGFPYEATYTDPVSVEMYGPFDFGIVDDQINSFEDAELRAKATVLRYAYPIQTGNFTLWKDDLKIGMNVHIHEDWLGIDGEYIIRALNLVWEDQYTVRYEAQFGAAQPDLESYLRLLEARTRWQTSRATSSSGGTPGPGTVSDISIVTGGLSAAVINSVNAERILGFIEAGQIGSVNAISIIGKVQGDQIDTINATSIQGFIQADQIGSINAVSIQGVILSSQLADQIIDNLAKYADALRPVRILRIGDTFPPVLPNAHDFPPNSYFWYEVTGHFYRVAGDGVNFTDVGNNPDSLTGTVSFYTIGRLSAQNIIGLIVAGQIENITAGQITGAIQAGQIATVNASTIQGSIEAHQIGSVNASVIQGNFNLDATNITIDAGAITGTIRANQIGSIDAATITIGQLQDAQIASVSGAKLMVGSVSSDKFNGFSIDVGGLANLPGRIRVFDGSARVVAQMGYLGEVGAGAYGGWFQVFGAGGTWWGDAPLFTDLSGNLTIRNSTVTNTAINSSNITNPSVNVGGAIITSVQTFDPTYGTLAMQNNQPPDMASFISRGLVFYYGGGKIGSLVRSPGGGWLELECTTGGAYVLISGGQGVRSDNGYWVGGQRIVDNLGNYLGVHTGGLSSSQPLFTSSTMQAMQGLVVASGFAIRGDGVFIGSAIATTGTCNAGSYVGGAFYGAGVNVGANGITCGYLSTFGGGGTIDTQNINANGQVNTNTLIVAGRVCAQNNAVWIGQGVQCNDYILGSQFGIYGVAFGTSGTFQALDGRTVQVRGGLVISIG